MAVDMALAQLVASIVASAVAYALSKSGKQIWRPILGFILGWIVGWVAGFFLGMAFFKGDTVGVQMRAMGTTFWMALIFSGVGVFLGRRKLKSDELSKKSHWENTPEAAFFSGSKKVATPNQPSMQMNASTETSRMVPTPRKPSPTSSTLMAPDAADEDYFYGIVANELETGNTDRGLWIRLFAEHDGDDKKTKIAYIKRRAEKLAENANSRDSNQPTEPDIAQQLDETLNRLKLLGYLAKQEGQLWRVKEPLGGTSRKMTFVELGEYLNEREIQARSQRSSSSTHQRGNERSKVAHDPAESEKRERLKAYLQHAREHSHELIEINMVIEILRICDCKVQSTGSDRWKITEPLGGKLAINGVLNLVEYAIGRATGRLAI